MTPRTWLTNLALLPFVSAVFFVVVLMIGIGWLLAGGGPGDVWTKLALWTLPWIFPIAWLTRVQGRMWHASAEESMGTRLRKARAAYAVTFIVWILLLTTAAAFPFSPLALPLFFVAPFAYAVFPLLPIPFLVPALARFQRLALTSLLLGFTGGLVWLPAGMMSSGPRPEDIAAAGALLAVAGALGLAGYALASGLLMLQAS